MIPEQALTFGTKAGRDRWRAALMGCVVSLCAVLAPDGVQAQSAFGCSSLETHTALAAVEGTQGMFFAIEPELQGAHAMDASVIAQLAELSDTLSERGTTLVLLPVPSRAHVMSAYLPAMARHIGYDPEIAMSVHMQTIEDLRDAGLSVADARGAMRQAALAGDLPFFATDPRPTPRGVELMAQAVAGALRDTRASDDIPRASFTTTQAAPFTLASDMRARLQLACQDPLPPVTAASSVTAGAALNARPGVAAVLGGDVTATTQLNLAGYISEASGLRAGAYGITGGGAFAAISSYLTSADFRQNPPQVIVWEFLTSETLARFGDQPMAELIAAAGQTCTVQLPLTAGDATNKVLADLSTLRPQNRYTLALDTGGAAVPDVRFHFTSEDGQTRSRGIYRHPDQILTGRFYMPLSGLEATGLQQVMIELPAAFGAAPTLSLCLQGDGS